MAEYRYYLIPDAMTRAFPEKFEKQTPTEFFDNIADLEKRYHQLREMPYNNERTWNERARFPYARLVVGIDRQNPDGAVAIIQVRNGVNYLCDDYRGPYADGSDAQIPQMAKKLVEVIGVDRVRPHTYTQRDGYTWVQVEKDKLYKMAPGKTAQSINVSLGLRMSAFNIPSIANICADDTIDLRELGSEKKVALFVVTPDTTTAYNFLAAVMFQQCFQILVDIADHRPDKRLPRHLRFLLDEFPNIGMIPDFQILISTIRSRDIACTLIYQSLNQLKSQYKDDWATIYENCDSMIVLGAGGNPENLEFFSKALGKATIEVMNTSENKGSQGSYTKSYQALGRELMTPEEIRTMPRNWCLLMISGVAPFYSRKYNLKDHPNYHLVEAEGGKPFDYDKRAEQSFADFISNVKDVKTVKLCAENNN